MIRTYKDFLEYVRADSYAKGIAPSLYNFVVNPIFRFTWLLRLSELLENAGAPLPLRWMIRIAFRRISIRLGFTVPLNVFGPGLAIVHYGLLVVSPYARIGRDCRVHAGVNIGGPGGFLSADEARKRAPRIGDRCYIGPGAKIYGDAMIADDCAVGANAVVTGRFCDSGVTIAGVPGRVVSQGGSVGLVRASSMSSCADSE